MELNIAILNAGAANDYDLYSTGSDLEYAKSEIIPATLQM